MSVRVRVCSDRMKTVVSTTTAERATKSSSSRSYRLATTESATEDDEDGEDDDRASVFRKLNQRILHSLTEETVRAERRGQPSASDLSVMDSRFNEFLFRPEPTLLDILEAWKGLLTALLQQEVVFTQYVDSLEKAFRSVSANHKTFLNNSRCIRTLLDLLTQAVNEHARDDSIECRFVTLLEVLQSYGPNWEPSEEVSAMWVRLLQRIPENIAPVKFRRKAYRVLVSLSWVPSSKGLLEACSFEESKQVSDFKKDRIREHMARIRGGPLPRYDSVNQLLDRLKDETDVCVAITSEKEGIGKTTLAGQVASHHSIVLVFTVLWLDIKQKQMTYDLYVSYLNDLCKQIQCPDQGWPVCIKRFEEPALRSLRGRDAMKAAKAKMSGLIVSHGRNVLLILDDVRDEEIIEWFRFHDRQSVIVTTPHPDLKGVDWTLELVPVSAEEGVELFLKEAGLPVTHILGDTVEVRSIVRQCQCNPLTVRTIARWYQLKQVTAGMKAAIEEILADLSLLNPSQPEHETDLGDDPNMILFDILSLMMGPARANDNDGVSALFVLCFAAQVVVFPDLAPLDAVLLLWTQVLKMETLATEELGENLSVDDFNHHAWLIAQGLSYMGVLSVVNIENTPWVQVHHALYKDFAILMAREMDLNESFQQTAADWHMAFVTGYFSRKSDSENEKHDNSWEYTIEKLPSHMFDGKMVSTAEYVLGDKHFFEARIEAMGWKRGIETHIEDCVLLQHELEGENEQNDMDTNASLVFSRTASLLKENRTALLGIPERDRMHEEAQALYLLGFALTENGYYEEALEHFDSAEKVSTSSQTLQASILYASGWCLLATNQTERAKNKINSSRSIMGQEPRVHGLFKEILLLYADALVNACEYQKACTFLGEVFEYLNAEPNINSIELGMTLFKQGRLYFLMGEYDVARETLIDCVNWKINRGDVSRSLSAALGVLGDIDVELGLPDEADERYRLALQTLESLHCDAQHLDYRIIAGKLQLLNNDFVGCRESFELVRRTSNQSPLKAADQSAYDLRSIARAYEALGCVAECAAVLRESLVLTENRPYSLERARGNIAFGNCLLKQGEDKEALVLYKQAREIQLLKLGDSIDVIDTTNLIGSVHQSLGDNDRAIRIFKKNYETIQKIAADDIERVAGVLYLIGDACDAKGAFAVSSSCFTECIGVLKRDRSPDHPDIAKALQRLGEVTVAQKDLDKAFDYYSQALTIRRMSFDDTRVAETLHSLGILSRKRGELERAEKYLLDALDIWKRNKIARDFCESMLELGNIYRLRYQLVKASEIYAESLEKVGEQDTLYGNIQLAMGHAKLAQGDYAGSLNIYEVALSCRVAAYGNNDLRTGNVSRTMGLATFLMYSVDEALNHLNEFVRVCDNVRASESLDFALTQLLLGDIFDVQGQYDGAKAAWERAKGICNGSKMPTEAMPGLILPMLDRRLVVGGAGTGYLSRTKEAFRSEIRDPDDEESVLQKILFVDD